MPGRLAEMAVNAILVEMAVNAILVEMTVHAILDEPPSRISLSTIPQVLNGRIIARGSPRQVRGPYGRVYAPTGT
jgi:hypothetical protein